MPVELPLFKIFILLFIYVLYWYERKLDYSQVRRVFITFQGTAFRIQARHRTPLCFLLLYCITLRSNLALFSIRNWKIFWPNKRLTLTFNGPPRIQTEWNRLELVSSDTWWKISHLGGKINSIFTCSTLLPKTLPTISRFRSFLSDPNLFANRII